MQPSDHMSEKFFPGAKVLELFSTYESILPPCELGPTVGCDTHHMLIH